MFEKMCLTQERVVVKFEGNIEKRPAHFVLPHSLEFHRWTVGSSLTINRTRTGLDSLGSSGLQLY